MFKQSIEAIIESGLKNLKDARDQADRELARCQGEIKALSAMANDVPSKFLDRYSQVLVATIDRQHTSSYGHKSIRLDGYEAELRGISGDEMLKPGKYRVVVLLEPIS